MWSFDININILNYIMHYITLYSSIFKWRQGGFFRFGEQYMN